MGEPWERAFIRKHAPRLNLTRALTLAPTLIPTQTPNPNPNPNPYQARVAAQLRGVRGQCQGHTVARTLPALPRPARAGL
eukprot:scaffold13982_cov56-Phaeocystis_antarctica.AAC.1